MSKKEKRTGKKRQKLNCGHGEEIEGTLANLTDSIQLVTEKTDLQQIQRDVQSMRDSLLKIAETMKALPSVIVSIGRMSRAEIRAANENIKGFRRDMIKYAGKMNLLTEEETDARYDDISDRLLGERDVSIFSPVTSYAAKKKPASSSDSE